MTQDNQPTAFQDENHIIAERRAKLTELRKVSNAFPNDFRRDSLASELHHHYNAYAKEVLEAERIVVKVAGRMMFKRVMGKASFATIQDMSGRIQLYISNDHTGQAVHEDLQALRPGRYFGRGGDFI
jgi:lysyl-tRNA synthetase, class II